MQTTKITLAGITFTACKTNEGKYGISALEYQKHLGLSKDFTTDCKRGKSPELLQEAGIHTGLSTLNVRVGKSTTQFIDTKDYVALTGVFAARGNKLALTWIIALANETIERRIDDSLGVTKSADDYELSTKKFFRELARKSFIPKLTVWNDVSLPYGRFVNEFKQALRLPLSNIDGYDLELIERWSEGITAYNALRYEGYCHNHALIAVRQQQADI
jgi:hypothetical protein